MNILHYKFVWLFCFALVLPVLLSAQPGRTHTPESLKHEAKFIEAQKQKILGNRDEAIELLEDLLKRVDTLGGVYYELARLYASGQEYKEAQKYIEEAVRIQGEFQPFWEAKAKIEVEAGENKKAAESYGQLIELAPEEQVFYEKRAHCFERMGAFDRSIELWDTVEQKFGLSETVIRKKHTLYHSMGKTEWAEAELEHWSEARPRQIRPLLLLAQYRERIGKKEQARKAYEKIIALDPDHSEAKLALMSGSKGDDRAYLASIESVVRDPRTPLDLKIKQLIPYVEKLAKGDTSLAQGLDKLSGFLRDLHGDEAKSWSISGDIAYYRGQKERAVDYYLETVDRNPRVFPVWEQLLRTLAETHQYEQLETQSDRARDYFPNQGLILYFKGLGLFGISAYDKAESILNEALIMSSASPEMQADIYALLSAVASRTEQYEASEEYIEKGLSKVSNHPDLLLNKASLLIRQGEQTDEASEILDRVEQMVPYTVEVAHLRGWLKLKQGRADRAAELMAKALEASTHPSADLLEHYGDALKELDNMTDAKKYWEQALEQGGNRNRLEHKIQAFPK